jgi:hypothetical protein
LIAVGLAFTIVLAVRGTADKAPTVSESVAIVCIAGLFQVVGAFSIALAGRTDPGLARSAVRRLLGLAKSTSSLRINVEAQYEAATQKNREILGIASVQLSMIEEGMLHAIEDWREVHYAELRELVKDSENDKETDNG